MDGSNYSRIILFLLIVALFPVVAVAQQVNPSNQELIEEIKILKADMAALRADMAALQEVDPPATFDDVFGTNATRVGNDIFLDGVNLHIRNGLGSTDGDTGSGPTVNGTGNLIIGYDEARAVDSDKSGSHNLVIGPEHNYPSYGGLVSGFGNTASGVFVSISGGLFNTASSIASSISGGFGNEASGFGSSISGGVSLVAADTIAWSAGTVDADILALEGMITTQDGLIATIQSEQATQNTDITALQTENTSQTADIAALQSEQGIQDASISALQMENGTQGTTIAALQAEQGVQNGSIATLQANVSTLQNDTGVLIAVFTGVSRGGNDIFFDNVNVHVRNGTGSTAGPVNSTGNLIVGYNEIDSTCLGNLCQLDKIGSHNLVVGSEHTYTSFGGLVAGFRNTVSGTHASVSGGRFNTASGTHSSISGGESNIASGQFSSVSGGSFNEAGSENSSVSGGSANIASGVRSSISGGSDNEASGENSSIGGGQLNLANGVLSSIGGGQDNEAFGRNSSISGGSANRATGFSSSVSGGRNNQAIGLNSSVSGGFNHFASGTDDWRAGSLFEDF